MLLADVDGRQLGLRHGCSVIHQHHHRVDVNVIVILWWCGRSPNLCWKITSQNITTRQSGTYKNLCIYLKMNSRSVVTDAIVKKLLELDNNLFYFFYNIIIGVLPA